MGFHVIISVNDDPIYLACWPLAAQLWRKLWPDVRVTLGYLQEIDDDRPDVGILDRIEKHGDLLVFRPVHGIPSSNQSRVLRHFIAALPDYADDTVMVNDVDLWPLQREYYEGKLREWQPGQLLAVGGDFYHGTPHAGKFPMGYATAKGRDWKRIMNPAGYGWKKFVESLTGVHVFDRKETILSSKFCDESLLRALLKLSPISVVQSPMGFVQNSGIHSISRWKPFEPGKLDRGEYIEAHHLLPARKYAGIVAAICQKFSIAFDHEWYK